MHAGRVLCFFSARLALSRSWVVLAALVPLLGRSWAALGRSWGGLGVLLAALGPLLAALGAVLERHAKII